MPGLKVAKYLTLTFFTKGESKMDNVTNANDTSVKMPTIVPVTLAPEHQELAALQAENDSLKKRLEFAIEPSDLSYQNTLDVPPMNNAQLYGQACSSDTITIESFIEQWLEHLKYITNKYDVKAQSVMNEYGKWSYKPMICAGSGPSLKKNAMLLKGRDQVGLVSCLHNFGYLEDLECPADYYVTLDSQEITISETFQGGKKDEKYYWDLTKDRTLVSCLVANPKLLEKWQGKILFYNTVIPDDRYMKVIENIKFNCYFNTGGNALGASYYMARAICGANPIAFIGADFSFSSKKKFHAWDSPYDKMFSGVVPVTDIFGNRVYTWQSYYNFSKWFEFIALGGRGGHPTLFYNCTEGGILGAYPNGNIKQIIQMPLSHFLHSYDHHKMQKEMQNQNSSMLLF